ncbi:uncharacterized protein [Chelonus insularis]|uniref:uncharacterized protein n=1 Tax=Chelonus insularis TaxID=460826 RepID=UPI00158C2A42|nr:uncharacterized protein LOC118070492 [Chelonus insularis]
MEERKQQNAIEPCDGSWASPVVLVPKKGDDMKFVKDFATIAKPLYLICQEKKDFIWDNSERKIIAYFSKTLNNRERNYCGTKKELLAVVISVEDFRHCLLGKRFTIKTDHASLTWLLRSKNPPDQIIPHSKAIPLPNHQASTIAEALVTQIFCRYGVAIEIHSDQDREFESEIFKEVMSLFGIKKTRTTPLYPRSNGLVKRLSTSCMSEKETLACFAGTFEKFIEILISSKDTPYFPGNFRGCDNCVTKCVVVFSGK